MDSRLLVDRFVFESSVDWWSARVGLAAGRSVGLAAGRSVGLAAGRSVGLAVGRLVETGTPAAGILAVEQGDIPAGI